MIKVPDVTMSFELTEEVVLGQRITVFADRHRNLRELLEASLAWGDRDYLVDGDRRISYAAHHAAVARVAAHLASSGVRSGDRVAIFGRNSIEWVVTFWATVSLGAIAVGLNGWWSDDELAYAVNDCEPAIVVDDLAAIEALLSGEAVAMPDVAIDEDDPAVILYTSGTTGRAKGATHSHRNLICLVQTQQHLAASRVPPGVTLPPPRVLTSTPLFHVSGLHSGVVACLAAGGTTIWQSGRFDPRATLSTIERERCTSWTTMPTTLWRVLHEPTAKDHDLTSMRHVGGGGAAWSAALQAGIREVFGAAVTWGIGYGLTECTGLATTSSFADLLAHPDNVGRPVATVEVRVEETGEICIRGPMVMLGYWRNPVATAAVIDDERWLHSGDLGEVRDGLLFLSARRTDLILRGAENVYPAEIENCLEAHPAVAEVAVVGVPDEEFGQLVAAVVVPAAGIVAEPEDLASHVKDRLAYFKVPTRWVVRTEPLPRTATGKVVRAEVLDQLMETMQR
jgi:acyl-CoA synthetase (AMP-forming)/AMP-acid ligase II